MRIDVFLLCKGVDGHVGNQYVNKNWGFHEQVPPKGKGQGNKISGKDLRHDVIVYVG